MNNDYIYRINLLEVEKNRLVDKINELEKENKKLVNKLNGIIQRNERLYSENIDLRTEKYELEKINKIFSEEIKRLYNYIFNLNNGNENIQFRVKLKTNEEILQDRLKEGLEDMFPMRSGEKDKNSIEDLWDIFDNDEENEEENEDNEDKKCGCPRCGSLDLESIHSIKFEDKIINDCICAECGLHYTDED